MPSWEMLAAALGIAYLLLAARESLWCWAAGFASNAIYLFVLLGAGLLMDAGLQVYYMGVAVYGWSQWRRGGTNDVTNDGTAPAKSPIRRWRPATHLAAIAAVCCLSLASGLALSHHTEAARPLLDSFTTWGAVLASWMVARKLLENWLYWIAIDAISIYLYLDRGLHITAALFVAYTIIAIFGFRQWLMHYRAQ